MRKWLDRASQVQPVVLVAGLVVVLLAVGYVLLPFEDPHPRSLVSCGTAITAWADRVPDDAVLGSPGALTLCAREARQRLWRSAVVLVLGISGTVVAFRVLRPDEPSQRPE